MTIRLSIAMLTLIVVSSCAKRPPDTAPEVVLYVSADEHFARQVISAFEQDQGVTVKFIGDSEAMKTTGLVNRLLNEKVQLIDTVRMLSDALEFGQ